MTASTLDRVVRIIIQAAELGPDVSLDGDTPLVGSGISLDSVAVLELLVGLEKEFRIEIDADELLKAQALRTVGTLAGFIDSRVDLPE
jgi:acyl carrier protein